MEVRWVISDGEALYALLRSWDKKKRKGKDDVVEQFRQAVLRMWPAFKVSDDDSRTKRSSSRHKELKRIADGGSFLIDEEQGLMEPFHVKEAEFGSAAPSSAGGM